jgi:hypothetical protein
MEKLRASFLMHVSLQLCDYCWALLIQCYLASCYAGPTGKSKRNAWWGYGLIVAYRVFVSARILYPGFKW